MKANWLVNWLQANDYEYERNIGENEVWRNKIKLLVIHPDIGVKLIYRLSMFNESYTESVIESDLKQRDEEIQSKLKNTPGI